MCTLTVPFKGKDMKQLYQKVVKGEYPPLPAHFSIDLKRVIKELLYVKPDRRPSCGNQFSLSLLISHHRPATREGIHSLKNQQPTFG